MPQVKRKKPITLAPKGGHAKRPKAVTQSSQPEKQAQQRSGGSGGPGSGGGAKSGAGGGIAPGRRGHSRSSGSNANGVPGDGANGAGSAAPSTSSGSWQCRSVIDRQAAEAVARLLQAAETRSAGATIKSLTLAPHVVHKKPTFAVTCQTLKREQTCNCGTTGAGKRATGACSTSSSLHSCA
jgi:hypothetical protein